MEPIPMYSTGITKESTAAFIEALANDKAARIKALSRTAVILTVCPEWMRADEVTAYFGVPPNQLKQMVIRGEVIGKKLDRTLKSSACIFRVSDIRKAIDKLEDYKKWLEERPDINEEETNGGAE